MSLICKLFGHNYTNAQVLSVKTVGKVKTLKLAMECPRCGTMEIKHISLDAFDLESLQTRNRLILSDQLLKSAHGICQRSGKQTNWTKFEDRLSDALLDNTTVLHQVSEEIFKPQDTFMTRTTRSKD